MLEYFADLADKLAAFALSIKQGGFRTHLWVYGISLVLGIAVSQLFFYELIRVIAGRTKVSHDGLKQTFRGLPTLWGILLALYAVMELLTIPARPLAFMNRLFHSVLILSLTVLGARLGSLYLKQKFQKTAGTFSSTSILATTIDLIVYSLGLLFLLQSFGISITPLLTALGVGGLAVALALQDTLSNLFSGINILMSRQIKIGDYIRLSTGEEGTVVDMNWRNTAIRQMSDNMVIVPNQKIATTILTNFAQPFAEGSIVVPVSVSYDSDLKQVARVTAEVAKEVLRDTAGGIGSFDPFIRYNSFGDSGIHFNAILRVQTIADQHLIRHEFLLRLHERYRQEGIVIPYPVRTVRLEQTPPR